MKKLKLPSQPAHRRAILKSTLDQGIDSPSASALSKMMKGFKPQSSSKPSTGARNAPRARLVRQRSDSTMTSIDDSLDRMIASALVGGPQTTGVLSSLFGLTPSLTGR